MTETATHAEATAPASVAIADGGTATTDSQLDPCFTIEIEHEDNTQQRYRYEPAQEKSGWWRYTEEWAGTHWECQDTKRVQSISLSVDGSTIV